MLNLKFKTNFCRRITGLDFMWILFYFSPVFGLCCSLLFGYWSGTDVCVLLDHAGLLPYYQACFEE